MSMAPNDPALSGGWPDWGGYQPPAGNPPADESNPGWGWGGWGSGGNWGSGSWEGVLGDGNTPPSEDPNAPPGDTAQQTLRAQLENFLRQYGLTNLMGLVDQALVEGWSMEWALLQIRSSNEYKERFKGNELRVNGGFSVLSEDAYLAYEDTIKSLAQTYGFNIPGADQIAQAIGNNKAPTEIEHAFRVRQQVLQYGDFVKSAFNQLLGADITDEDLQEFFDPTKSTPEWDELYTKARIMGQPAMLGLGTRSKEEAEALMAMGINPDEAFQRYQTVGMEKDRFSRLAAIEGSILGNLPDNFGDFLKNVDNKSLIDAIVFNKPDSLQQLQSLVMREVGRHNQGGGPVQMLTPEEQAGL